MGWGCYRGGLILESDAQPAMSNKRISHGCGVGDIAINSPYTVANFRRPAS